jgi:hypothetical protein
VPCPYHSLPHNLFPLQFDPAFLWADPHGEKGAPKLVAVVEVVGLRLMEGQLWERVVRVFQTSHVAAHQMRSRKLAFQMGIEQQQMACWPHLSSHHQTRSQVLEMQPVEAAVGEQDETLMVLVEVQVVCLMGQAEDGRLWVCYQRAGQPRPLHQVPRLLCGRR